MRLLFAVCYLLCLGGFVVISLLLILNCSALLFSVCGCLVSCVGIWFGLVVLDVVYRLACGYLLFDIGLVCLIAFGCFCLCLLNMDS